ncbi:carbohydrate-binding module family 20 domain-containing protein [Ideonella sp.]|uniref:carbohydrate-binding module family 20 domain-containing protein n=1 Tax=Ideonella sp. TaxID=1929293 RepID=UPI002B47F99A|nr:carbohydrate-binding module family 20 domain-containing protein [Ideonella sp.]HJV67544.1 carbohydrate-binding module family 20 domain-containing protein [Ideonella sp.]
MTPHQRTRHAWMAAACLVAASFAPVATQAAGFNPRDTSVQLFEWSWNDIATECSQWLGPQGYGAVQISPPGASKNANGWWGVYQPVNHVNLTSRMGTAAQLQTMINTCHAAGVRVYADIVTNQLADGSSAANGVATDGSSWDSATLSYPYFSGNDFHSYCNIQDADYNSPAGRNNVMLCRLGGLPDLASESSYVQGQVVNYLNTLLDMGVDGFRIDAAKHQQPSALQSIFSAVKASHPTTKAGEPIWITQEVLPDGEVNRADYFPIGTINEFQFTFAMRDAFRNWNGLSLASIPSVMGTWGNWGGSWGFVQPQNATILVDNWDTERNGSSLNASNYTGSVPNDTQGSHRYDLANIFMLAQGYGEAQVQSGFRFTNKDADRPSVSPYLNGVPQINVAWDFIHRWQDISNMVKFRSAAAGQPQANWTTGNANQVAFSRGSVGFVAINNTTGAWTNTFYTGLPAGTYCNVVHGSLDGTGSACKADSVVVNGSGYASISVPADGGSVVPAVAIYTGQKVSGSTTGCAVSFTIANANTVYGQNLRVVGNVAALGSWAPAAGFALTIQGSGANVPWSGSVNLPANAAVQYKYVKWDGSSAVWESNQPTASGNREFTTCASATQSRDDGKFKF